MKRSTLLLACIAAPFAMPASAHEVIHAGHEGHVHAKACGHQALEHDGHVDYLHDGHLHHADGDHVDEHALEVTSANPAAEELAKTVSTDAHAHGHAGEEHMSVQHGAHTDYIHDGRLHHLHGNHTDDHGPVKLIG